jgi:hypothetical protein
MYGHYLMTSSRQKKRGGGGGVRCLSKADNFHMLFGLYQKTDESTMYIQGDTGGKTANLRDALLTE